MTWVWATMAVTGVMLGAWANYSLPKGTVMFPIPKRTITRRGPYRWAKHPMYIGNVLLLTGLAGLGGGFWNACAMLGLAELVHREWAWREDKKCG